MAEDAALVDRMRLLLRLLDINQGQLAEAGGVKRTTVVNWLGGKGQPTAGVLSAWTLAYGLNGHWLLTGEGEALAGVSPQSMTPFERDLSLFEQKMKSVGASPGEIKQGYLALAKGRGKEE